MVAPRKLETRTRQDRTAMVNNIVKAILSSMREQKDNDVREVKVNVLEVGHGHRPFGNHFPNDFIDFTITAGKFKEEGLGKWDVWHIGNLLKQQETLKGFDLETKDVYFGWGNFTPDIEDFPAIYRKFKNKKVRNEWLERQGITG